MTSGSGTYLMNCKNCGSVFITSGGSLCSKCLEKFDSCYETVRLYLEENPRANIEMIAQYTGVSKKVILQFLRDGRLQIKAESYMLSCQLCGKPIESGKYCTSCLDMTVSKLRKAVNSEKSAPQARAAGRYHVDHKNI